MSQLLLSLLTALALVVIAQHRLSDGERRHVRDPAPELWGQVHHSGADIYAAPNRNCPLLLSLNPASPYTMTSVDGGVRFDIDADGDLDQVSWTPAGSDVAFLAFDRNGDGRITDGKELLGARTVPGVQIGLPAMMTAAKESASGQHPAAVDGDSPLFLKLVLWTDTNHDGISDAAELRAAHHAVSAVGLGFQRHHRKDRHGNESHYRGFVHVRTAEGLNRVATAEEESGRRRPMYDACLVTR